MPHVAGKSEGVVGASQIKEMQTGAWCWSRKLKTESWGAASRIFRFCIAYFLAERFAAWHRWMLWRRGRKELGYVSIFYFEHKYWTFTLLAVPKSLPHSNANATHESVASQQRERREMAKTTKAQRKCQAAANRNNKKIRSKGASQEIAMHWEKIFELVINWFIYGIFVKKIDQEPY